ncbi:MAG: hypothetical protein ACFCUS_06270 [Rubrimonas sp.]
MPVDPLAALRKLAELKEKRALAELAAAQARARAEAEAAARADAAVAQTYDDAPEDGAALQRAWAQRGAFERAARAARERSALRDVEAGAARDAAALAHARALGAADLQRRAASVRAQADARRAERATGVLTSLRRPLDL